jgi:hypothetical protein
MKEYEIKKHDLTVLQEDLFKFQSQLTKEDTMLSNKLVDLVD